jgi:hypothetical protein
VDVDRALEVGRRAATVLDAAEPRLATGLLHVSLATASLWQWDLDAAEQGCARVLTIAETIGSKQLRADALAVLGTVRSFAGRRVDASALLDEAWEIAEATSHGIGMFNISAFGGMFHAMWQNPHRALAVAERGLSRPQLAHSPGRRAVLDSFMLFPLAAVGRQDDQRETHERVHPARGGWCCYAEMMADGRFFDAAEGSQRHVEAFGRMRARHFAAAHAGWVAHALWLGGDGEGVVETLDAVDRSAAPTSAHFANSLRALALAGLGRTAEAEAATAVDLDEAEGTGLEAFRSLALATSARARGRVDAAIAHAQRAIDVAVAVGDGFDEVCARAELGRLTGSFDAAFAACDRLGLGDGWRQWIEAARATT